MYLSRVSQLSVPHPASSFGVHNYEMPKFDLPKMEMPDAFREMAEKGVAQAKDNYEKIQAATVEATELLKDTPYDRR